MRLCDTNQIISTVLGGANNDFVSLQRGNRGLNMVRRKVWRISAEENHRRGFKSGDQTRGQISFRLCDEAKITPEPRGKFGFVSAGVMDFDCGCCFAECLNRALGQLPVDARRPSLTKRRNEAGFCRPRRWKPSEQNSAGDGHRGRATGRVLNTSSIGVIIPSSRIRMWT